MKEETDKIERLRAELESAFRNRGDHIERGDRTARAERVVSQSGPDRQDGGDRR